MSELISFLRSDWRTLVIDMFLGLAVLAIVCAWSWKLALVAFAVLSYIAGAAIIVVAATFIGIVLKEKLSERIERHRSP